MPTNREREYYRMGFTDGLRVGRGGEVQFGIETEFGHAKYGPGMAYAPERKKRKLSAWNKYVKANSKKPRFRYRNGKLNLKKMAVAFRKTPAGRKKRR
jgi:hypothetical protein